ncbi:Chemotaxis response regulator protein-glutamate methylesterase [Botrimarina colliarenosi]|uniref:Protein-glutamate methylesterase/protein-glutamine glutaminase n=1 Tax=Botrimarina colliarenosi TaxID=2528001 RepID=A0A5C6AJL4_9BACT|nr:chemotaxis response regulator protein-glutamate methylesterase [Botrimarina colliarenosi]TWT99211.1 Chemotaxis response regulator protein-glutamate methylesterase [Botrimarina colliarenosi]
MSRPLKCLVVDDSALYRKIVRDVLAAIPSVEVVGSATDGERAVEQIAALRPDLVTLDLEMPRLDGIGVLRKLQDLGIDVAAIMVSAFTARGAKTTTEALSLGAFDFILKPTTNSLDESILQLRRDLLPKVQAVRLRRIAAPASTTPGAPSQRLKAPVRPAPARPRLPNLRPEIVAIGVSTGGPQALNQVLPKLPANFPAPIVVVQHMPPMFTKSLAEDLNRRCQLRVSEATQGQPLRAGEIVIAPGGRQMRVAKLASGPVIQLTDDPPERNCKPSADFLFRSVASNYGARVLGVVLTGMGDDGCLGSKLIKASGGVVFAQDEPSCVVYGMPKAVVDGGFADEVLPLNRVADHLIAAAAGRVLQ